MLSCKIDYIEADNRSLAQDVCLSVGPGAGVAVVGPSGSGKSLLLNFIAGLVPRTDRVRIVGVRTLSDDLEERAIAFVSQDPDSNMISDTVMSELLVHGVPEPQTLDHVLSELRIPHHLLGQRVVTLSGGEKQLLAMACALARQARILVLDEPTAMLDPPNTSLVLAAVNRARDLGSAVIVATHAPEVARSMDRVVVLKGSGEARDPKDRPAKSFGLGPGPIAADLTVNQVSFRYRRNRPLLEEVDFRVGRGDVLHITGANGSGKSTLGLLCAGLLKPSHGNITVNGCAARRKRRVLGKEFALGLQNPNSQLLFGSVWDEVSCGSRGSMSPWDVKLDTVVATLAEFQISREQDPHSLSFGQRKLVTNFSFAHGPAVQIFDEPEVGLDKSMKKRFCGYVEERQRYGYITIIISHRFPCESMAGVKRICL